MFFKANPDCIRVFFMSISHFEELSRTSVLSDESIGVLLMRDVDRFDAQPTMNKKVMLVSRSSTFFIF